MPLGVFAQPSNLVERGCIDSGVAIVLYGTTDGAETM